MQLETYLVTSGACDIRDSVVGTMLTRKVLGFSPQMPFQDGLADVRDVRGIAHGA